MDHGLPEILQAIPGRRILVAGDVMLDEYIWGEVRRISPEAPVPVVDIRRRTYVPGGASNTALNVIALGGQVLLGGVVGADHPAGRLRDTLHQGGVAIDGLHVDPARITTTKTRILAHSTASKSFASITRNARLSPATWKISCCSGWRPSCRASTPAFFPITPRGSSRHGWRSSSSAWRAAPAGRSSWTPRAPTTSSTAAPPC
jgi:hypothetical protein